MEVKLISCANTDPLDLASFAAGTCYQDKLPELGKRLNVKDKLFSVGHHTTLQHHYATFAIEEIAVGDITFGMHLASPFYNSDQRSGRYCAKMFLEPDYGKIENYIKKFWPEVSSNTLASAVDYVKKGVETYHSHIAAATELAAKFVAEERPRASAIIKGNIPKYAQEQMRMFISVIFPTAFVFTINDTALAAMYEAAWTPPMRYASEEMARLFVEKYPETAFMFNESRRRKTDWAMSVKDIPYHGIKYRPDLQLLEITRAEFNLPNKEIMHPIDMLHFTPETMENNIPHISSLIEISTATMGQDQRHRTIKRGLPRFTGNFYIPPVLRGLKLEKKAIELMNQWAEVSKKIPDTLAMILAPYGAMVSYAKSGSLNAIAHEQAKRLCWSAQEEIYHLGRLQRLAVEEKLGKATSLLKIFEPPCYEKGICSEGERYCGRDRELRKNGDYFPGRKI
ncbi:hypothetical protein C4572_03705 [Candidatus Parcubacteria bacterium]|nr:MAG: hypothetical protein C4572_03705 [Candidatus Parcubacteria bacterium]